MNAQAMIDGLERFRAELEANGGKIHRRYGVTLVFTLDDPSVIEVDHRFDFQGQRYRVISIEDNKVIANRLVD